MENQENKSVKNGGKSEIYQEKPGGPFKQGNPGGGHPKGTRNFGTLFDEAVRRIVKEKKLPIDDPEIEMVTRAVVEAMKGNYMFYRDTMDRKYGRPKEQTDITSGGEPIQFGVSNEMLLIAKEVVKKLREKEANAGDHK